MWRRVVWGVVFGCVAAAATGGVAAAKGHPFTTPGYHWNHKLPKVAPVIPGKLIKLGDGVEPRVLVDAAGTGQIAYNVTPTDVSAASVLHDCVLLRGQTGCASNAGLIPPETGDPQYNIDEHGPVPLSIGNELLMVDSRFPNVETMPDGTTGYPTFLWTSEDAGKTFTGPGTIGNLEITGNAVVFGGTNPQIGVITDTTTGGTFFQATPPGAYSGQTLNLGDRVLTRPTTAGSRSMARARWPSSRISPTTSTFASTTASATSTAPRAGRGPRSTARAIRGSSAAPAACG